MRYLPLAVLALCLLLSVSCVQLQQQSDKESEKEALDPPPLYLGTVHQVYLKNNFAVLRLIGPTPAAGVTVISHPADGSTARVGNLSISTAVPPRQGFVSANIRAGTVLPGDRVYLYREVSQQEPKEQEEPYNPEETETGKQMPSDYISENRHPSVVSPPSWMNPADDQKPVEEDDTVVEVQPEQENTPPAVSNPVNTPSVPLPSGGQGAAPSYLDDIPDSIEDWN